MAVVVKEIVYGEDEIHHVCHACHCEHEIELFECEHDAVCVVGATGVLWVELCFDHLKELKDQLIAIFEE